MNVNEGRKTIACGPDARRVSDIIENITSTFRFTGSDARCALAALDLLPRGGADLSSDPSVYVRVGRWIIRALPAARALDEDLPRTVNGCRCLPFRLHSHT